MEFKSQYTKEEVEALIAWARSVDYEGRLDIGGGQVMTNAKVSIQNMANQIEPQIGNVNYSGMIHKLFVAKETLEKIYNI